MTNHKETIERLKNEIKERLDQVKKLEREQEEVIREVWNNFKPKYRYTTKMRKSLRYEPLCLRITATMTEESKAEHARISAEVGPRSYNHMDPNDVRVSVGYLRGSDGILSSIGGGWELLKAGVPISEDDWIELCNGINIEKWLYSRS